jgi:hypothetical protein
VKADDRHWRKHDYRREIERLEAEIEKREDARVAQEELIARLMREVVAANPALGPSPESTRCEVCGAPSSHVVAVIEGWSSGGWDIKRPSARCADHVDAILPQEAGL